MQFYSTQQIEIRFAVTLDQGRKEFCFGCHYFVHRCVLGLLLLNAPTCAGVLHRGVANAIIKLRWLYPLSEVAEANLRSLTMNERDDLALLSLSSAEIDASSEQINLAVPTSRDEVVTTALLRRIRVRRTMNERGDQCSCGSRLDSSGPIQSDEQSSHLMHNSFVIEKLTLITQQLMLGLDEILRAIALMDELPTAQCPAEANDRAKIQRILNLLCLR